MLRALESRREVKNLEENSVASTPNSTRPPSPLLRSFAGMALTSNAAKKPARSNPIAQKSTSAGQENFAEPQKLDDRLQDIQDDVKLPEQQQQQGSDSTPNTPDSAAASGPPTPAGGVSRKGSVKRPHISAMRRPSSVRLAPRFTRTLKTS